MLSSLVIGSMLSVTIPIGPGSAVTPLLLAPAKKAAKKAAEKADEGAAEAPQCRLFPEGSSTLHVDAKRSRVLLRSEQACAGVNGAVGRVLLMRTTNSGETRIRADLREIGEAGEGSLHRYVLEAELDGAPEGSGTFSVARDDGEQAPKAIGEVSLAIQELAMTTALNATYLDPVLDELVVAHPPESNVLVVDPLGRQETGHHVLNVVSLSTAGDVPLEAPRGHEWRVESSSAFVGVCYVDEGSQALDCSKSKVTFESIRKLHLHVRQRIPTEIRLHLTLAQKDYPSRAAGVEGLTLDDEILSFSLSVANEATSHSLPVPVAQAAYVVCPSRRGLKGKIRVARQSTVDAARDSVRQNECRLVITEDEYLHQVALLHGIPSRLRTVKGTTAEDLEGCAHTDPGDYWKGEQCLVWSSKETSEARKPRGLPKSFQQTSSLEHKTTNVVIRLDGRNVRAMFAGVLEGAELDAFKQQVKKVRKGHRATKGACGSIQAPRLANDEEVYLEAVAFAIEQAVETKRAAESALEILTQPAMDRIDRAQATTKEQQAKAEATDDAAEKAKALETWDALDREADKLERAVEDAHEMVAALDQAIRDAHFQLELEEARQALAKRPEQYEQATRDLARLHGPQVLDMYVLAEGTTKPKVKRITYNFSSTERRPPEPIPTSEPILDPSKTYEVRLLNRTAQRATTTEGAGTAPAETSTSDFEDAQPVGRIRSRGAFGWPSTWRGNSIRVFVTIPANVAGMKFPASPGELHTSEDTTAVQLSTLDTGALLAIETWNYRYATNPLVLSPLLATGFLFRGFSTSPSQLTRSRPLWVLGPQLTFPLRKGDNQRDISLALGMYWAVDLRQTDPVRDGSHFLLTFGVDILSLFGAASAEEEK